MKQVDKWKLYKQHFDAMAQIGIDDGIYKVSDAVIDEMYERLLACLPNDGKLYKYRKFTNDNNCFENAFSSLAYGYIWLASPCLMNDKIDTTLRIDLSSERRKINKFLIKNKDVLLRKWLVLLFEKFGIENSFSIDDMNEIINCYTKQGRAIKTKLRSILQKYKIPYNRLDTILKRVAEFIEKKSVEYESVAEEIAEKFVNMNTEMRNRQRIFCMSESPYIDSMWAYYGNDNKGFCIEYDFNKGKSLDSNKKRVLLNLFRVKYTSKKSSFSFVDMLEELIINGKQDYNNIVQINQRIFDQVLTKNKVWSNEKEWRIVVSTDVNRFDVDLVSAIYIDIDMIKEENGKRLLDLAKQRQWKLYGRELDALKCGFVYNSIA